MTPEQLGMCHTIKLLMRQFYGNPENEARFQKWKEERRAISSATDLPPRAPSRCHPTKERHIANLTASAT